MQSLRYPANFDLALKPDVPVVLPVDNAEIRRVSGQYNLVRLVTSEWHEEEMKEVLNPPYEATIKVLDVICNSPWSVQARAFLT